MDDGQVVCHPPLVDPFLRVLDEELRAVGATRGRGPDVKSVARLVGSPRAVAEVDGAWATEYVALTCRLPGPNADVHLLGVDVGDSRTATTQFRTTSDVVEKVHEAIGSIGDAAVELVLTRACADACKVTHLLRAQGPAVSSDALDAFDGLVRQALCRAVGTTLREESLAQAALGVQHGGLGLRQASDMAAPAFIASRVGARPVVRMLVGALCHEGLLPDGLLLAFDARLSAAVDTLVASLPPEGASQVKDLICDAECEAEEVFSDMLRGRRRGPKVPGDALVSGALVTPAGSEDPEMCDGGGLQQSLCKVLDGASVEQLSRRLLQQERWTDARRIRELRDPSVSHDWLWALNPAHGPTVPAEKYATCVRLRLGAFLSAEPFLRERCGAAVVDRAGSHALCCAAPEGTRGRYAVRDALLPPVHLADPSAQTEVPELIPTNPA